MKIDTNRAGYYKVLVDGVEQPENYNSDRTALDAAINLWIGGADNVCISQPDIVVTGERPKSFSHPVIIDSA